MYGFGVCLAPAGTALWPTGNTLFDSHLAQPSTRPDGTAQASKRWGRDLHCRLRLRKGGSGRRLLVGLPLRVLRRSRRLRLLLSHLLRDRLLRVLHTRTRGQQGGGSR